AMTGATCDRAGMIHASLAMGGVLPVANTLGVQVKQAAGGVVAPLELFVHGAVVEIPEAVLRIEDGRIQGLASSYPLHFLLDPAVVMKAVHTRLQRHARPESHVDVEGVWGQTVELPCSRGLPRSERAQPDGRDRYLALEVGHELFQAVDGYLHV